ncbi:uncharacterized protein [Asterias amurensis]|uniref:uncharacterized protein isoform X2 n=1 Tax=Asterias amurensis TaxID=7602 RepID=UPI003AB32324
MAEIENLQQEIDSCGKEQIEQHVEEEIVHELVSSEQQSWRLDAADETTPPIEVPDEEDTEEDGQQHDEPGRHIIAIDGRVPCGIPGDPDENEEDPQDDEGDDSYDGHGVFFLDSEDEVKQKVSDYEKNTGTHFIMLKKEKGYSQTEWKVKRLNWSQKSRATVPIAFDGTPFMYLGQVLLSCQHGKDKNIGIKKKYREKAALRSLNKEDDYTPTKRLLSPSTKKMGCPALISIKKVVKFPDFKVPVDASSHTKRKMFQQVAEAMKRSPESLNAEMKFYLKIPSSSKHKNHPPEVCPKTPGRTQLKRRTMAFKDVVKAASRIADLINLTPIHTSSTVDRLCGRTVYFKAELMQKTGSFKVRGALNAILSLKESGNEPKGVVTHSTGNHGQALAYAAQLTGVPCVVVVPHDTPAVKVQAILQYQAEIIFSQPTQASRKDTCEKVRKARDYHFVSPYDDVDVIAGQGTLGLELLDQCPFVQAILIPTSGGGLAGGIATAVKGINKDIKIYCVEPEGKDLQTSLQAGKRMWPEPPQSLNTVADAIRTQQLGKLTWPILRDKAEKEVFTVNDDDIVEAMKFAWTRLKLCIEPAAATGVAAVLSEKMKELDPSIQNVAVVLCGGNVDIERLPWEQNSKPDITGLQWEQHNKPMFPSVPN